MARLVVMVFLTNGFPTFSLLHKTFLGTPPASFVSIFAIHHFEKKCEKHYCRSYFTGYVSLHLIRPINLALIRLNLLLPFCIALPSPIVSLQIDPIPSPSRHRKRE